jgi:hypothetical protein
VNLELFKRGRGFLPAGPESEDYHAKMEFGEFIICKVLGVRDVPSFRRYWKLMTVCAANCECIELPYSAVMFVQNKRHVHTAIKLCTGYCDTIFDNFGAPAYQIPKSTDFESMTQEEWKEYWPRVLDVVQERIMPGVSMPLVIEDIERLSLMGMAA